MTTEITSRRRSWLLLLGLFVLAAVAFTYVRGAGERRAGSGAATESAVPADAGVMTASTGSASGALTGQDAVEPEPLVPADAGPADEVPAAEGIAVFPPLGTQPVLSGIIVPDDFELPPGYVRHYQASDDGEPLPAILMYHPRRGPVDASGQPIPVTADRIVPPERAPEGMPIVILELPKARKASPDLQRLLERQ